MDSMQQSGGQSGRTYQPYRQPPSEGNDAASVQRKPVPQWHEDGYSRALPSNASNIPSPPPSARFQSYGSQYFPTMSTSAIPMVNLEGRPEIFAADSFHSSKSNNSNLSGDISISDARLIGPPSAEHTPKIPFPSPPYDPDGPYHSSLFKWRHSVWMMYVLFGLGVAGAFSHHLFYKSLAGKEAHEQLQMLRYGAAMAYCTKALLVASLLLAFRQQIWATCRRKLLSIDTVDSLFALTDDPAAILKLEVLQKAKVALFLASVMWLAPLVVILTPASLTVEPVLQTNETTCSPVRTLNFTPEAAKDWRIPTKIDGLNEISLSFWNTTSKNLTDDLTLSKDPNLFDYYDQPSFPIAKVATLSAYLQRTMVRTNAAVDTCGAGWNCSYTISFKGPGYKCTDQSAGTEIPAGSTIGSSPFTASQLLPQGNFTYLAHTSLGDYVPSQIDSGNAGNPSRPPPYPSNLGVFRTEPLLWIGYAALRDPQSAMPANSSNPAWATAFEQRIFACEHYETLYKIRFNYSSGTQTTTVLNRTFLSPIINTTYVANRAANDGTKDSTIAIPETNYIFPKDVAKYRITAAYHSLGLLLRKFINGTIEMQNNAAITKTEATKTKIIDLYNNYLPKRDLMDQIQSFYEDIILSIFSNPQFLVVAWASKPSEISGVRLNAPEGEYECTKSRIRNVFVYHARDLWLVYGFMLIFATLGIAFGSAALSQNAWKLRHNKFSSIVAATRGSSLDRLPWQTTAWGEMSKDVGRTKVGYGIIGNGKREFNHYSETGEPSTECYGFGLEGEVDQGFRTESRAAGVMSFKRWHYVPI